MTAADHANTQLAKPTVTIEAVRHKGETWSLHITYPDGSYEHRRGVVDYGYAGEIAQRAIWKAEDMADPSKFGGEGLG